MSDNEEWTREYEESLGTYVTTRVVSPFDAYAEYFDDDNQAWYYYNLQTQETSWELPNAGESSAPLYQEESIWEGQQEVVQGEYENGEYGEADGLFTEGACNDCHSFIYIGSASELRYLYMQTMVRLEMTLFRKVKIYLEMMKREARSMIVGHLVCGTLCSSFLFLKKE